MARLPPLTLRTCDATGNFMSAPVDSDMKAKQKADVLPGEESISLTTSALLCPRAFQIVVKSTCAVSQSLRSALKGLATTGSLPCLLQDRSHIITVCSFLHPKESVRLKSL